MGQGRRSPPAAGGRRDADAPEVAAISLAIQRGPASATHSVEGPGGSKVAVGDAWPRSVPPGVMTAEVEVYEGRLAISLAMRVDSFDDRDWVAFEANPTVVCFSAASMLGNFWTETSGLHVGTAFRMDADDRFADGVRRALRDVDAVRTLTLFGISGYEIRSIKVGISLDRIWTLLDEAIGAMLSAPVRRERKDVLAELSIKSTGRMFADAMALHLRADPC